MKIIWKNSNLEWLDPSFYYNGSIKDSASFPLGFGSISNSTDLYIGISGEEQVQEISMSAPSTMSASTTVPRPRRRYPPCISWSPNPRIHPLRFKSWIASHCTIQPWFACSFSKDGWFPMGNGS